MSDVEVAPGQEPPVTQGARPVDAEDLVEVARDLEKSPPRQRRGLARRRARGLRDGMAVDRPVDPGGHARVHQGSEVTSAPGQDSELAPASAVGAVVEPTVFLAIAVRSYLEGVDQHGAEHPVTLDRLARLRDTLAVHDSAEA